MMKIQHGLNPFNFVHWILSLFSKIMSSDWFTKLLNAAVVVCVCVCLMLAVFGCFDLIESSTWTEMLENYLSKLPL